MRIGVTEVQVEDQDRARQFYTQALGLQVKTDVPYGEDARWLTVVSPEEPDGTALLLGPATGAGKDLQQARREAGVPVLSFTTDECRASYEQLRARGVTFLDEPRQMPYGGIDAVFEDGCGNLLNLHED